MGRASTRKRATRPATAAPTVTPDGVVIPRSVRALTPQQLEKVHELTRLEVERRQAVAQLDELLIRGRRLGLSWSVLGWAMGVSGQAAQQRHDRLVKKP